MNCACGLPARKNGFCQLCHCRNLGLSRRDKRWTPEHELMLRRCYAAGTRKELSRAVTAMVQRTNFSREYIYSRARRLDLAFINKRGWTQDEIEYLRENHGAVRSKAMAKSLKRSYHSVESQLARMGLSGRISEGYSGEDVSQLFGVGWSTLKGWERRGILKRRADRFNDIALRKFAKSHPHEYDLRRVDQAWFKGLVFGENLRARA